MTFSASIVWSEAVGFFAASDVCLQELQKYADSSPLLHCQRESNALWNICVWVKQKTRKNYPCKYVRINMIPMVE